MPIEPARRVATIAGTAASPIPVRACRQIASSTSRMPTASPASIRSLTAIAPIQTGPMSRAATVGATTAMLTTVIAISATASVTSRLMTIITGSSLQISRPISSMSSGPADR